MLYSKIVHKTIILSGPQGSGKSTLARKLAFEKRVVSSVIYAKSPTLSNIQDLLDRIEDDKIKCVVLDEVGSAEQSAVQNFISLARRQYPKLQVIICTLDPMFYLPLSIKYNLWEI